MATADHESLSHGSGLQGLGINCIAGALVPTLLAVGACWWQWHLADDHMQSSLSAARARHVHDVVAAAGEGALAVLSASRTWSGAALITVDNDAMLTVLEQSGALDAVPGEAGPHLIAAVERPVAWIAGGRMWAATRHQGLASGALILAQAPAPAGLPPPWGWSALLLAVGILLAWYLSRRIHRPIQAITQAAAAVADGGESQFRPRVASTETRELASTVGRLAQRSSALRSTSLGDSRD
jgi:HAMP domain-containing protein